MNKHCVLGLAALLALAACNRSTQLAVRAVSSGDGGEETGRNKQVIRLLPYDRDSIFRALAQEYPQPEPKPPADLIALRDSVSEARTRWNEAEATWNEIRSELADLSKRMDAMNRSSNEYFQAYQRFDNLDAQVRRLDREVRQYFDQFTELQNTYRARADSFNAVSQAWGDAAFDSYGDVVEQLLESRGLEELEDTTDADGWAMFAVPRGRWFVHTRAPLVFEELYWNVPYESMGGADTLTLNDANAEVRPIF